MNFIENSKPHWTSRPASMLAAVLAVSFLEYLLSIAAALPLALISSDSSAAGMAAATVGVLQIVIAPGIALLFYWFVRRLQKRNGAAETVSWKIGIAFWVGLALMVAGALLSGVVPGVLPQQLPGLLSPFSAWFAQTLFFVLLFPVVERRFGLLKGALLISLTFAALSLLESVVLRAASTLLNRFQYGNALFPPGLAWHGIAAILISGLFLDMALYMARAALYLAASRRVPGTWALVSSATWLVVILNNMLVFSMPRIVHSSSLMTLLCVGFPYSLLVFSASLAAIACLRRWKTFGDFVSALKELLRKARRTQSDTGD